MEAFSSSSSESFSSQQALVVGEGAAAGIGGERSPAPPTDSVPSAPSMAPPINNIPSSSAPDGARTLKRRAEGLAQSRRQMKKHKSASSSSSLSSSSSSSAAIASSSSSSSSSSSYAALALSAVSKMVTTYLGEGPERTYLLIYLGPTGMFAEDKPCVYVQYGKSLNDILRSIASHLRPKHHSFRFDVRKITGFILVELSLDDPNELQRLGLFPRTQFPCDSESLHWKCVVMSMFPKESLQEFFAEIPNKGAESLRWERKFAEESAQRESKSKTPLSDQESHYGEAAYKRLKEVCGKEYRASDDREQAMLADPKLMNSMHRAVANVPTKRDEHSRPLCMFSPLDWNTWLRRDIVLSVAFVPENTLSSASRDKMGEKLAEEIDKFPPTRRFPALRAAS